MRELFSSVPLDRKALAFFLGVVVLTVIGPFGTYEDLTLGHRVAFWTVALTAVGFFMHVLITLCLGHPRLAPLPKILRILLGAAAAGLPGAAVIMFIDGVFRPPVMPSDRLWLLWVQVAVIGVVFGLVEFYDWTGVGAKTDTVKPTRLHARLPKELGDDIISLSMSDHYVEISTARGKHMELMRMADAIEELNGLDGLRIHRSHWVARKHIVGLEHKKSKLRVHLSDARKLPVSATYADDVRAALDAHSADA